MKRGDVLGRLSGHEGAQAAIAAAQLELVSEQQALDALNRTSPLAKAESEQVFIDAQNVRAEAAKEWEKFDLDTNKGDIIDAQDEFDKYSNLDEDSTKRKNAADDLEKTQEDYNEAVRKSEKLVNKRDGLKAALDAALAVESEAKRTLDNSQTSADKDKLILATARLDNAKAQAVAGQHYLDLFDLKALFDGEVVDTNVTKGEWIGPDKWAVLKADKSQWYVDTSDLTELDAAKVRVGQEVTMTADAIPEITFNGTVEEISQTPDNKGGDVLYKDHIRILDPDPRLRWGMTMDVTFSVK